MKAVVKDVTPKVDPVYETTVTLTDREVDIIRIALDVVYYQKMEDRGVSRQEVDKVQQNWDRMSNLRACDGLQEIK